MTELNFALLVLSQIWQELDHHTSQEGADQEKKQQSSPTLPQKGEKASESYTNQLSVSKSSVHSDKSQQDAPFEGDVSSEQDTQSLLPLDYVRYESIETDIMDRIQDIQREIHKRPLQHLLDGHQQQTSAAQSSNMKHQQQQQQPPAIRANQSQMLQRSWANKNTNSLGALMPQQTDNLYDTVADALDADASTAYHRPPDLPEMNNSNLDSQRHEIETWLNTVEQRLAKISIMSNEECRTKDLSAMKVQLSDITVSRHYSFYSSPLFSFPLHHFPKFNSPKPSLNNIAIAPTLLVLFSIFE